MSVIGIIAEYNPFHNGHLYHLQEAFRLTGASSAVCIMSGDFLQRGTPAVADKYSRAYTASSMGIDVTFELPVLYAAGNASDFAMGAVSMLDSLCCVDYLCFGTETLNPEPFFSVSDILAKEPASFSASLKDCMKAGYSYPKARETALTECLGPHVKACMSTPNNILAIEYLTALKRLDSSIKPILIPRKEAMYHDHTLRKHISSATAIREALYLHQDITKDVPEAVYSYLIPFFTAPQICTDDFSSVLAYLLCFAKNTNAAERTDILDMNEDMMNRFLKCSLPASYHEIASHIKTKNITMTRVNRALLHLMLNIRKSKRDMITKERFSHYANLLSFRKETPLMRQIKNTSKIPVITKKKDYVPESAASELLWSYDRNAVTLYNQILFQKTGIRLPEEYASTVQIYPK